MSRRGNILFEFFSERHIVEEDVGVVILMVKGVFHLGEGLDDVVELVVAYKDHKCGVSFP